MNGKYSDTREYWNKVFVQQNAYIPSVSLPVVKLEKAVQWLCTGSSSVLDFGCGWGRVLSRCLDYGVIKVSGIDLSAKAIEFAKKIMEVNGLQDKSEYICGDVDLLKNIDDDEFDGVILFNILDNLCPDDTRIVIKEINRILKPGGKMIIKLNSYLTSGDIENYQDFEELSPDFYQDGSGLYLWNIHNDLLVDLVSPTFKIVHYDEIEYATHDLVNRIFYLQNT